MTFKSSSQFIKAIKNNPQNFYIIHYSCQSLNDDNEGLSPRITSIGITHFSTEQTVSFSTHSIAEELHISREFVRDRFDEVEFQLLTRFFEFVRDRRDKNWVHWNMRNLTYGFEHLEHRFSALGGKNAPVIPVERRVNLNDILSDRYGANYANHPKMLSLMELNGGMHRDFLTGAQEVEAFQANEFIKMHKSTLFKLGFFYNVIRNMLSGHLKTKSRGFGVMLDKIFDGRFSKFVAFITGIITFIGMIYAAWGWLSPLFFRQ